MANIRDLKKDINFVLGDIIDAVNISQSLSDKPDEKKADAIIDDAIQVFDNLVAKVSDRKVENRKTHLSAVRTELEEKALALVERVNKL